MNESTTFIELHNDAFELLKNIEKILTGKQNDKESIKIIYDNVKITSNTTQLIRSSLSQISLYHLPNKKIKRMLLKKMYNTEINKLRGILTPSSTLHNICNLTNQLKLKQSVKSTDKLIVDLLTLDAIDINESKVFKLSNGNIGYDNINDLLSCLLAYVDICTYDDVEIFNHQNISLLNTTDAYTTAVLRIVAESPHADTKKYNAPINTNMYDSRNVVGFRLNIKFPHSSLDKKNKPQVSTLRSDSIKIWNVLCDGNMNNYGNSTINNVKYNSYYTFITAVNEKIYSVINLSYNIPDCKFQVLHCPTSSCSKKQLVVKHTVANSKKYACSECHHDICGAGCGKLYHGETSCDLPTDELDLKVIKNLTNGKKCPKCFIHVEKSDGCNHMTCACKCQFCYKCDKEFTKDTYKQYMVTEHYRECIQFDSDEDFDFDSDEDLETDYDNEDDTYNESDDDTYIESDEEFESDNDNTHKKFKNAKISIGSTWENNGSGWGDHESLSISSDSIKALSNITQKPIISENDKTMKYTTEDSDADDSDSLREKPVKSKHKRDRKKKKLYLADSDSDYDANEMAIAVAESLKHEKPEKFYNVLNTITSISSDVDSEDVDSEDVDNEYADDMDNEDDVDNLDNEVSELIKKSLSDDLDFINNAKDRIAALKLELEECTDVLNSLINK